MVDAVRNADLPVIQTVGLSYCLVVLADQHRRSTVLALVLDPRARRPDEGAGLGANPAASSAARCSWSQPSPCVPQPHPGSPRMIPNDQDLLAVLLPPAWMSRRRPRLSPRHRQPRPRQSRPPAVRRAEPPWRSPSSPPSGAALLGTILAHIAGYLGGPADWIIGRAVDVWMSFPPVVLSLILMVGLGGGVDKVILAIILVDWTRFCRVLRSDVVQTTRRDYVTAARLAGYSHWQTVIREVLPATLPLGHHPRQPRNGHRRGGGGGIVLRGPRRRRHPAGLGPDDRRRPPERRESAPIGLLLPMAAIFATVAGFNLLGDGLRRIARRAVRPRAREA